MKILVACEESQVVTKAFRKRGHEAYSCDLLPARGGHPEWHLRQDVTPLLDEDWDMILAFPDCTYLTISAEWAYKEPHEIRNKKLSPDKLYGAARLKAREQAAAFFMLFANNKCPKIAIENPVGVMSTLYRKPDQIVQPWMFGEDASKSTCLWLKGLQKLRATKIIPPKGYQIVKYAMEMPLCPHCEEEAYCEEHQEHFGDCSCIGPTQDDVFYKRISGFEFGTFTEGLHPIWANQTPGGYNKLGPSPTRARDRSETYRGIAGAMAEKWG